MMDFSKQLAVIAKLKSLVKIPTGFRRHHEDENQISESIAKKIQKSSFEKTHQQQEDVYTPPYKIIAEQLQSSNDQIFRAAVFNLTNIALNRKQYSNDILLILEKTLEDKIRSKEQLEYVRIKIGQIRQL